MSIPGCVGADVAMKVLFGGIFLHLFEPGFWVFRVISKNMGKHRRIVWGTPCILPVLRKRREILRKQNIWSTWSSVACEIDCRQDTKGPFLPSLPWPWTEEGACKESHQLQIREGKSKTAKYLRTDAALQSSAFKLLGSRQFVRLGQRDEVLCLSP